MRGRSDGSYVTTQATSKRLKVHRVLSGLMLAVGVGLGVATMSEPQADPAVALVSVSVAGVGLLWYYGTRARIWWDHG